MKTKNAFNILLAVSAIAIFSFSACKKDVLETEQGIATGPYASLADFYNHNGAQSQTFTIDPQQFNAVTGVLGTSIIIPANSIFDNNGLPPSGNVTVTLKEIYDIKDMLLSHIPTTSNGSILQSGGMFYLDFAAGNIHYNSNSLINVSMPSDSTFSGMNVFFGLEDTTGMNWVMADSSSNFIIPDSSGTIYNLWLDSLGYGWVNCDRFYNTFLTTNVSITPTVTSERNETVDIAVYLLLPSINSCMNVNNSVGPQTVMANNIPIGMQAAAAAVGVGRVTKKAYFGLLNFTVAVSQPVTFSLTQMSETEISNALQNL